MLARLPVGAMLWQNPRSSKDAGGGDAKVSGDGSKSKGFKKVIKSDAEWRQLLTPEARRAVLHSLSKTRLIQKELKEL